MTMFPRHDTHTVRVDKLKLMYAIVKRRKVSPVKYMMQQWLEVFSLTGDVECTYLVTRIATNLGLMRNAIVSFIAGPRTYIDFEYFKQGHILKRKNGKIIMIYRGYTNEIPLPNRNLGLYAVQSLTLDLQKIEAAPHRSMSARMTRATHPQYYVADPEPEETAYASYAGFKQAGPSQRFQPKQAQHTAWSQSTPEHLGGTWQQAPSEEWHGGNFEQYHGSPWQEQEVSSGGHHHHSQGGRMSFSGCGYHDFQMTNQRIDNRLQTIEESQAAIQNTLHNHAQWQANMGHELANL